MIFPTSRVDAPNGVIAIEPIGLTVRATLGERTVVTSDQGIRLLEAGHDPVYYFPLADVTQEMLRPSDTHTVCPRKGPADYFDLVVGDTVVSDALWTYPEHYDGALDLSGYVSFYWERIDTWFENDEIIDKPSATPGAPI